MMAGATVLLSPEVFSLTPFLLLACSVILLFWGIPAFIQRNVKARMLNKIPGPPTVPLLGNASGILRTPSEQFKKVFGFSKLYGKDGIFRLWFGPHKVVMLTNHKAVEPLVTSNTELHKAAEYTFFQPWLGNGLITISDGAKWHSHRKLLTPAFHFKILEDFLVVMNKQAKVMVKKLYEKADGKTFDIYPYIKMCALDIICESAMGVSINAQESDQQSEYVQAIIRMAGVAMTRNQKPWLRSNLIWQLTQNYRNEQHDVKVLKGFTNSVIKDRKKAMESQTNEGEEKNAVEGIKKRKAFLDLILSTKTADGKQALSDQQIQEEVDTFMFAGHDTTTVATNWFTLLMALHPEIQERLYEEIIGIMGDKDTELTAAEMREMKYLDCCMKEALRVLPSVPFFARKLMKDTLINGYLVPAGTSATVFTYALHRDPEVWKDPETFNPDRFAAENIAGTNPYAYIPFSAGPRNCIGQKFAQWEERCLVSHIIRNFKITTDTSFDKVEVQGQIVLTPADGINVKLTPRK